MLRNKKEQAAPNAEVGTAADSTQTAAPTQNAKKSGSSVMLYVVYSILLFCIIMVCVENAQAAGLLPM